MLKKISFLTFAFYLLTFFGCATIPQKEAIPTYSLNGATYFPLSLLCRQKSINFDYDTLSRTLVLSADMHKINAMVGETMVLVDGSAQNLEHRVELYAGAIVIPEEFKTRILDRLFKEKIPYTKTDNAFLNLRSIVVDAGHGGYDPGTTGRSGIKEKDVNLDIAKRLATLLKNEGIKVTLTRPTDNFVTLERRVAIANKSKADLFVSIHSNANRTRSLNGFEVYYTSLNVSDARRAEISAENAVLNLDSGCFGAMTKDLKATLWEMIYNYDRAESVELAKTICQSVDKELDTRVIGVKGAGFYVLKGACMPAILIEVGFLSNKNEEQLLKNTNYRQQITDAIFQGIRNYAKERMIAEVAN